jgi:hypothetical protein
MAAAVRAMAAAVMVMVARAFVNSGMQEALRPAYA